MKASTALLFISLLLNLAVGGAWIIRRSSPPSPPSAPAPNRRLPAATFPTAAASNSQTTPPGERTDPVVLRDQLRALGFPEASIRAAVRAHLEAPRLERERAFRAAQPQSPWWRPAASSQSSFTGEQSRELRELRRTERDEIARVLGPLGPFTPAELERYPYLPEEKAARLLALYRDNAELRRETSAEANAPANRAEMLARNQLLAAELQRDLAALLTPAERLEFDLRTSPAASIATPARYFPGSEAEFRAIYELGKIWYATDATRQATPLGSSGRSMITASQKLRDDLQAALGPERYAQWQRANQVDYTAAVELQRRFSLPAATIDAVIGVPLKIGEEGMRIARDESRTDAQKLAAIRLLADEGRQRVQAILGDDLGEAYNTASARGWLDHLERGMVPYLLPSGQRALFGNGRAMSETRLPPPKSP